MAADELQEAVRLALGGTATPMAARLAIAAVAQAVREGLAEDGCVRLAHFGTFRLQQRRPRRLRLPGSGEWFCLPERRVLCFSPSPPGKKSGPQTE